MTRPNPWLVIPSLLAGLIAAVIGWIVTDVSCRQEIDDVVVSCPGWSVTIALTAGLATTIGILVLLVLVFRSLAEETERRARAANVDGQQ